MGCGASLPASQGGAKAAKIGKTEERGITVKQLIEVQKVILENCGAWTETFGDDKGKALVAEKVNLYHTNDYVIKPHTKRQRCSYVELVADGPQVPDWFVSHWWGEPVFDFLACLREHSRLRRLTAERAYWVCAYANNQWDLDAEIQEDPSQTSFRKAMDLAVGTVSVVDSSATTFTRIWCSYEVATTLAAGTKLYDIATAAPQGAVVVMTDGLTPEDNEQGATAHWEHRGGPQGHKLVREKGFPEETFAAAFGVELQKGKASVEDDRSRILNALARRDLHLPPLEEHPAYKEANVLLRWRFGISFLHVAAETGVLEKYKLKDLPVPPWSDSVNDAYENMVSAFLALARYELAENMAAKHVQISVEALGEDHPTVGDCYNNMAMVYDSQARYELALEHFHKSLAIRRKALGEEHPDVGACYNNMANVYESQAQYELALEHYHKSLAIRRKALGEEHPAVGDCYNNMAVAYNSQAQYDLAMEHYHKSLAIRRKALGEEHPDVGTCYNNMAIVYDSQAQYDLAMEHYHKSLAIRRKALGEEHPDVGTCYNNMANVYNRQAQYDLAMEHYHKSLAIRRKALGEEHLDVGTCYYNMAIVYASQAQYDLALEHYHKSLAIRRRALGEDHPHVGNSHYNIAVVYRDQSNLTDAAAHFEKAASVYAASYGNDHPETKDALAVLAELRKTI